MKNGFFVAIFAALITGCSSLSSSGTTSPEGNKLISNNVVMPFASDNPAYVFTVVTPFLDINTGNQTKSLTDGFFRFSYSSPNFWVSGVNTESLENFREVYFKNTGNGISLYDSLSEASEYGYSSAPDGGTIGVEVISGDVLIFKVVDKNKGTSYGKLFIDSLASDSISLKYTYQSSGDRRF